MNGYIGQGKSILLKIISGDIVFENNIFYEGSIRVNNVEVLKNYSNSIRKKICYIPQEDNIFTEKTVLDEFLLSVSNSPWELLKKKKSSLF